MKPLPQLRGLYITAILSKISINVIAVASRAVLIIAEAKTARLGRGNVLVDSASVAALYRMGTTVPDGEDAVEVMLLLDRLTWAADICL